MVADNERARPSDEAIAEKAYELWLSDGQPEGRSMEHWTRAEQMLSQQSGDGRTNDGGRRASASPDGRGQQDGGSRRSPRRGSAPPLPPTSP